MIVLSLLFHSLAFLSLVTAKRVGLRMAVTDLRRFEPSTYPGVTAPLGFFDPLGMSNDLSEKQFRLYREAELKHGRVAMLAFLGVLFGERFPLLLGHRISGPAIYQFQQADHVLWAFSANVLGLCAVVETVNILRGWQSIDETLEESDGVAKLKDGYENGDLAFDPLDLRPTKPKALLRLKNKELNNGRLAMLAIAGIVAQELVTGNKVF